LLSNLSNIQIGFLLSACAALATLFGWGVVSLKRKLSELLIDICLVLAAAAMILVSALELIPAAASAGLPFESILSWIIIGVLLVALMRFAAMKLESGGNPLKRSALLVSSAIILHNLPEGSVAISTSIVDLNSGLISAIAISLHNIPEGLAIALTAVAAGMSNKRVLALVVAATLAELIGALVVFYEGRLLSEVEVAKLLLVVAGIMCTVAITELIPSGLNSWWKSRRWNAANRGFEP
jgi:ZIP family zinc transporter